MLVKFSKRTEASPAEFFKGPNQEQTCPNRVIFTIFSFDFANKSTEDSAEKK